MIFFLFLGKKLTLHAVQNLHNQNHETRRPIKEIPSNLIKFRTQPPNLDQLPKNYNHLVMKTSAVKRGEKFLEAKELKILKIMQLQLCNYVCQLHASCNNTQLCSLVNHPIQSCVTRYSTLHFYSIYL